MGKFAILGMVALMIVASIAAYGAADEYAFQAIDSATPAVSVPATDPEPAQTVITSESGTLQVSHRGLPIVPLPDCELDRDLALSDPHMVGDDVADLQKALKGLGFYKGFVDYDFGPATADALRGWQQVRGLPVTGVMTQDMWSILSPGPQAPAVAEKPKDPQGDVSIVIDTRTLTLTVLDDGQPFAKYPVAIGRSSTPTPSGEFIVINKWPEPGGPFGARWMGLSIPWGVYGIHGTNNPGSIGSWASHGCIRMFNWHVAEIYPWINVGTKVTVLGSAPSVKIDRTLRPGDAGEDVQHVQYKVRQAGFKSGPLDGHFGEELAKAILEIQRLYGLPQTGRIGPNELFVLGIR